MKGTSHHKSFGRVVILFAGLVLVSLILSRTGKAQEWKPAYTEEQLDLINSRLGKWKQDWAYPKVRDIFGGHSYQPDWNAVNQDATPWEWVPDSFPTERAARKAGGHC